MKEKGGGGYTNACICMEIHGQPSILFPMEILLNGNFFPAGEINSKGKFSITHGTLKFPMGYFKVPREFVFFYGNLNFSYRKFYHFS